MHADFFCIYIKNANENTLYLLFTKYFKYGMIRQRQEITSRYVSYTFFQMVVVRWISICLDRNGPRQKGLLIIS